ncbi:MAG TPA: formylmethanofuran dehydrogenase subunit E family protein [Candidatus Saccharimonadales bacterium]|nr:formylmethanofuran dehydrogenase subunit E family protein [Candidatus Saccharimonadales bacterium]
MKKIILLLSSVIVISTVGNLFAHDDEIAAAGSNIWNQAQEPTNWWNAIKQVHGHVGPWNVLGWRMGKAALRELDATWGQHQLDIICHIPLQTPYSCIADGLIIGTGNSMGRLDIHLSEVATMNEIYVSVRRKDGSGPVLLLKPNLKYMEKICDAPDSQNTPLANECAKLPEKELFVIEKIQPSDNNPK